MEAGIIFAAAIAWAGWTSKTLWKINQRVTRIETIINGKMNYEKNK